jgi:hypothetical protein
MVTLASTASTSARDSRDFFQTGAGAYTTTQS